MREFAVRDINYCLKFGQEISEVANSWLPARLPSPAKWEEQIGRAIALPCSPMPKRAVTFDTVRKIGLELPGVEDGTAYGSPALKVRGKLLACIPVHRSAEPSSLAVRIDFADRAALLAEAPDVYYVTDHYVPHPAVLVRLGRVTPGVLRDLLGMAYKFVTAKAKRRPPVRKAVNPGTR